jgi:hypothetical protein
MPEAQQVITGFDLLIFEMFFSNCWSGIFTDPLMWPPENSPGVLTSIMDAPFDTRSL